MIKMENDDVKATPVEIGPLSVPEVRIPDHLKEDIAKGISEANRLIEELEAGKVNFLVLPLWRSGVLAFEAVKGFRDKKGGEIDTKSHPICVGTEISSRFEEEADLDLIDYSLKVTPEVELPLEVIGDKRLEEYYSWLRKDETVRKIVQELTAKRPEEPEVVVIFDDFFYQGATLFLTAPTIARMAFPEAEIKVQSLVNNPAWIKDIVKASFPQIDGNQLEGKMAIELLSQIAKGYTDSEGLQPITPENIDRVLEEEGELIRAKNTTVTNPNPPHPKELLGKKFTKESLLKLHGDVLKALRQFGTSLD